MTLFLSGFGGMPKSQRPRGRRLVTAHATSLGFWLVLGWHRIVQGLAQIPSKNPDVVQRAPVTVQADTLGSIGIKGAVDLGVLGSLFGAPHFKSIGGG